MEIDPAERPSFHQEIGSLELALRTAPEEMELHPQLVTGKRVQIIGGPMKGTEGVILNADNQTKLWVGVTMMGAGATIEVHADLVEPLAEGKGVLARSNGQIELPVGAGQHIAVTRQQ